MFLFPYPRFRFISSPTGSGVTLFIEGGERKGKGGKEKGNESNRHSHHRSSDHFGIHRSGPRSPKGNFSASTYSTTATLLLDSATTTTMTTTTNRLTTSAHLCKTPASSRLDDSVAPHPRLPSGSRPRTPKARAPARLRC